MIGNLTYEQVMETVRRISDYNSTLVSLREDFVNASSQISGAGESLGGDLGEFSQAVMQREIVAKLANLSRYIGDLNSWLSNTAANWSQTSGEAETLVDTEIKG